MVLKTCYAIMRIQYELAVPYKLVDKKGDPISTDGDHLVYEGIKYHKYDTDENGIASWFCADKKCAGGFKTKNSFVISQEKHVCTAGNIDVYIKQKIEECKHRVQFDFRSITVIYKEMVQEYNSTVPYKLIGENGEPISTDGDHMFYEGIKLEKIDIDEDGVTSWSCSIKMCNGGFKIKDSFVIDQEKHMCPAGNVDFIIKEKIEECKQRVQIDKRSITTIYKEIVKEYNKTGMNKVKDMPEFSSIKSSLYRSREKGKKK
ncbi:uncharacterized protein LOC106130143 isoform X1 [Amyelois transitella]|uniref:uncharacterized protein LOC106130143 isoform X1 n=1 Tax=Amyelois transitella TaxID=680683 RepID=UPI0029907630|nr:uncharacterized protein LOC106130143 isoform X1 [Amyelois transitella]